MSRFKKKLNLAAVCVLVCAMLCGAGDPGLSYTLPKLDMEKTPIYDAVDTDTVSDPGKAAEYDGHDIVFSAYYKGQGKNDKVNVAPTSKAKDLISVSYKGTAGLTGLNNGDKVWVFGSLKAGKGDTPAVTADKIMAAAGELKEQYYFADGKGYTAGSGTVKQTLDDGSITYYIPEAWTAVEGTEGISEKVKSGCYYKPNRLKGSQTAECFCIFYFDYDKFVKFESDYDEKYKIEKAIISNIIEEDAAKLSKFYRIGYYNFPYRTIDASYGTDFDYYTTYYDNYHVEFVFTPVSDRGLCVMMYIYDDDTSSLEDILFLMRTLAV